MTVAFGVNGIGGTVFFAYLGGANTPAPNVGYCTNIDYGGDGMGWGWLVCS